jgi:hypothetical protein
MTDKEIAALSARVHRNLRKEPAPQPTITSGFDLEVLRLNAQDVKFLQDCGVKVE